MTFTTNTVELSLVSTKTGQHLTASVYDVTLDNGSVRTMSIGQLVMALCLKRGTEMEDAVVSQMATMSLTTENIAALSEIEQQLAEDPEISVYKITNSSGWNVTYEKDGETVTTTFYDAPGVLNALIPELDLGSTDYDGMISQIESKLDQINTISQDQMIALQSMTNKRDQSFEMISNILKSLFTQLGGVANNI